MAIETPVAVQFAADTGGGSQNIVATGFSQAPDAVVFIWAKGTVNGTPVAHARFGMGMADADSNVACDVQSLDAQPVGTADRHLAENRCIWFDPTDNTVGSAHRTGWYDSGGGDYGVTISWDDTPDAAYLITAIFFGGSDLTADVRSVMPTTGGTDVTALGFEPDCLVLISGGSSVGTAVHGIISVGFVANDGSDTQRAVLWESEDATAKGELNCIVATDSCCGKIHNGAVLWKAWVSGFDADGYTITSDATANYVYVLALNFNGLKTAEVGTYTSPTSGGASSVGISLTPDFLFMLPTTMTAVDTIRENGEAGVLAAAVMDGTRSYCNAVADEDGAPNTDTQSLSDDQAINVPQDDGSTGFTATDSFGADVTLTFTNTLGTGCYWPWLAIGTAGNEQTATLNVAQLGVQAPAVTAQYQAELSASLSEASPTVQALSVTAIYVQSESATLSVAQLVIEAPAVTAAATNEQTATLVEAVLAVQAASVAAQYTQEESATLAAVQLAIEGVAVTAQYQAELSAAIAEAVLTVQAPPVTASAGNELSASLTVAQLGVDTPAVAATYQQEEEATLAVAQLVVEAPAVTASIGNEQSALLSEAVLAVQAPGVTGTYVQQESASLMAAQLAVQAPTVVGQHDVELIAGLAAAQLAVETSAVIGQYQAELFGLQPAAQLTVQASAVTAIIVTAGIVSGPYRTSIGQVHVAGGRTGQVHIQGGQAGQVHVMGGQVGQVAR